MPTFEVLYKVGDSNPGNHSQASNWEDGQIISIKDEGYWWTAAQLNQWVQNDIGPPNFTDLAATEQASWNRTRLRLRRFTHPNFTRLGHINRRFDVNVTQQQLDNARNAPDPGPQQRRLLGMDSKCESQEAALQRQVDRITTHGGVDTNWGFSDLLHHGVVRVDATVRQLNRALEQPTDETVDVMQPRRRWAKRAWRVDYPSFLTAPQIADLVNPAVLVLVDRVTLPIPAATAVEPVVRDLVGNPTGPGPGSDP